MTTFAEALYSLPAKRLRAIVQKRGVPLSRYNSANGKRPFVQFLANELSRTPSIGKAILQCAAPQLRLLQILSACGGETIPWHSVLDMVGGKALSEALSQVVTHLEDLGLVIRLTNAVYLPEAVQMQVPASLPDRYTLTRCLNLYDALAIKRIYTNLALGREAGTKVANIEAIRAHLLLNGPGLRLKHPLDKEEIEVLEYLVQVGGAATPIEIASATFGHTDDFFRYDWQSRWKQGRERNPVDTLLARGILHVISAGYGFNLILIVPGDLLNVLTGNDITDFWSAPLPTPQPVSAPVAAISQHTGALRDVVRLMAQLAAQEAVRTNTGHIHKAALKIAARSLSLPADRYASFLYALCRGAGLIAAEGEKQVYGMTKQGASWLHLDAPAQLRALYEGWSNSIVWAEMYSDPLIKNSDYRPKEDILQMRHAALTLIREAAPGVFCDLGSLADALAYRHPLLLAQTIMAESDLVASPMIFVRRLVGECLYWLNMVEIDTPPLPPETPPAPTLPKTKRTPATALPKLTQAASSAPEPAAYRLTSLGAYLLQAAGSAPPEIEPSEDKFIVQANMEIFVPPYLEPEALYRLLTLTEPPSKEGTGNTVRLTRESLRRALDQGTTAREVLAFLQKHARTGIPQNIEYLVNEVAGKHGHIHIGKAQMYLQTDTPLMLQELQARRELKGFFVRALSDTVAILQADDPDKVLRELRKAGYLPISDDAPAARHAHAHTQHPTPNTQHPKSRMVPAEAFSDLDWARIARDDDKPWKG